MGRRASLSVSLVFLWLATGVGCAIFLPSGGSYTTGHRERGLASWYGEPFHGRKTASGEVYNMFRLSAAHRTIPLGTTIRVTHLKNGRSVTVRVNDRGPFIRGRIVDLSFGAARVLGMVREGIAPVELIIVGGRPRAPHAQADLYTVEVGAFAVKRRAQALARRLTQYGAVRLVPMKTAYQTYYRVRIGLLTDERKARQLSRRIEREQDLEAYVIRRR